jgi:hypothetical protein
MRDRLALLGAAPAMVLALALSSSAWAQQQRERATGGAAQNPTAGQERTQKASESETIRGVVAAVTAEGEMMFDYRTNRAAAVEGAFLTVVGSPTKGEGYAKDRPTAAETARPGSSAKKRHNVYYVWMTPRTKACECTAESQTSRPAEGQTESQKRTEGQNEAQKREVSFDQLEVGDHVEIQFNRSDETSANTPAHQNERVRGKHGRQRTFVGYASSITILPAMNEEHSASGSREKSSETPRSSEAPK